jgi:hypothetical protein
MKMMCFNVNTKYFTFTFMSRTEVHKWGSWKKEWVRLQACKGVEMLGMSSGSQWRRRDPHRCCIPYLNLEIEMTQTIIEELQFAIQLPSCTQPS